MAVQTLILWHRFMLRLIISSVAGLMIFWPCLYFAVYLYYLRNAYNYIHSAPWASFRIANILCRLQVATPSASIHVFWHLTSCL